MDERQLEAVRESNRRRPLTPKILAALALGRRGKHGHAKPKQVTRTYRTWRAMMMRCNNPQATGYNRYGGRGIKVCQEWHTFTNFLADMGERPAGRSLDRINGHSDYTKANCRWATPHEQAQNRRRYNA